MREKKNKSGQEEMVGFGMIIIIVAVILLVFLGFALRKPQKEVTEDYEVSSFVQAFLQYTTDCRDNLEYLSVQKLILDCEHGEKCLDGRDTCEVLDFTLKEIVEESWDVGKDRPVKGYTLKIMIGGEEILFLEEGNITNNYKGSEEYLPREIDIYFTAYS
ncbi:hypothetical protein KAR52_00780 [Candidatus Pacearchaeota archaeon]|nr:hypothetical protein [Candidatus Pacearchaeota archaeon]